MSSKTYIIAWDKALDNCLEIDRQLSVAGVSYKFFNVSSDKSERPNWERAEDVRYYGHFYNALKDFIISGKTVLGFNAGDPKSTEYAAITAKAEKVLTSGGIYAPNMKGDFLSENGVYLAQSALYPELYLATQTNGICVYMHRDIASVMYDFMSWLIFKGADLPSMHSGWGLDTAYCISAIYLGQPIYRDSDVYVDHPPGSSYESSKASKEMAFMDKYFSEYASTQRGWERELVDRIRQTIFHKARQRDTYELTIEDIYPEPVEQTW